MLTQTIIARRPWEDRWQQPDPELLLNVFDTHPRKVLTTLMENMEAFEGISKVLQWHGESWKWCWQFNLRKNGSSDDILVGYLVPNPQSPLICITLDDQMVSRLPMRRLNRYIRDGIRHAKCAVKVHWATWTPPAMTEAEQLLDLVKRKHKLLTQPQKK